MKAPKFKGVNKIELIEAARDQQCKPDELVVISKGWLRGFRAGRRIERKRRT